MSLEGQIIEVEDRIFLIVNGQQVTIAGAFEHNGVPYINGKKAKHDPPKKGEEFLLLDGAFSPYRCPECNAHLGGGKPTICLNGCHLTAAQQSRFAGMMMDAAARVGMRNAKKEAIKKNQGLLGEIAAETSTDEELGLDT